MDKKATLPDRCIKTNLPAQRQLDRKLYWHHPAVYLAILLSPLLYIIVALATRQTATISIGLTDEQYAARQRRMLLAWLAALSGVGLMIATAFLADSDDRFILLLPIGFVLLIGALLYGIFACRLVVAKNIDKRFAWIRGVCPEYLAELPDWPYDP